MSKFFNIILLSFLLMLLYGLFLGKNGVVYLNEMRDRVAAQTIVNNQLKTSNDYLQQKVEALKNNNLTIYESFIRRDLNFIRADEVFFRIVDDKVVPQYRNKNDINKFLPVPGTKPLTRPSLGKK